MSLLSRFREIEVIGQPECPLLFRRTLLAGRLGKVLWHEFLPTARDRDPHDHPRSFLTLVLRGGYDDVARCPICGGCGWSVLPGSRCDLCGGTGGLRDVLRAPAVRFRRAAHAHTTLAHADGATTLVLMGPVRRPWGFWRGSRWWTPGEYEERFGGSFRCEDS